MNVLVLTAGGPFASGDLLSVAFSRPTVGRLLPHDAASMPSPTSDRDIVPHAISARVASDAAPYAAGDIVTLSFVDPHLARIHANVDDRRPVAVERVAESIVLTRDADTVSAFVPSVVCAAPSPPDDSTGVRVRIVWSAERAKRFVRVVDRLFTIDRLGWYRHVFAMRLLVPDAIDCGEEAATAAATDRLDAVRSAAAETLGRPLLAAFMPNFCVSAEWLETIDTPAIARALGDLRDVAMPFAEDRHRVSEAGYDAAWSVGSLRTSDLDGVATSSVDAFLATLIPAVSTNPILGAHLDAYRHALVDVFSQTSHSAEAVRLGRMCEPNHVLDDRLWQLVGTIGSSFDALAVA